MAEKRTNRKIVRSTRSVALALIAMLELLLLLVSLTFSWFERALDPILVGEKISTAPALYSTVYVDASGTTVELSEFFEKKGSKTKFSPVHSEDGLNFTSPEGVPMNSGEIHAAALSFQFQIAASADYEFWFESLPVLTVNGIPAEQREILWQPSIDEDEQTEEATDEMSTEEASSESISEEAETENLSPEGTEMTGAATEATAETEISSEIVQQEESTTVDSIEEEKPETRGPSSYLDVFYIAFHDESCQNNGMCMETCAVMSFAEAEEYLLGNSMNNKLFTHAAGENGEKTTLISCSIWYQPTDSNALPEGATVAINLQLTNGYGETRTIRLADETTMLSDLYPQMGADGYYVELVDTATGRAYEAVYDSESDTWIAEIPLTVEEFDVHYRSKGIEQEIIATWDRIDGREVHSFALMDEGVFLSSEY